MKSKKTIIFRAIAIIVMCACCGVTVVKVNENQSLNNELKKTNKEVNQLESENEKLNNDITNLLQENKNLNDKVESLQNEIDSAPK